MDEVRWLVSTYNASRYPEAVEQNQRDEYGTPRVPVLLRQEEGVRVILGSHDAGDLDAPDIMIERQPAGWVVMIHPQRGGDPWALIFLRDDGRTFIVPESPWEDIEVLQPTDDIPGFGAID